MSRVIRVWGSGFRKISAVQGDNGLTKGGFQNLQLDCKVFIGVKVCQSYSLET